MSVFHNQVQLVGRAGHDVDLHALTDGTPLARLRLYQDGQNHAGESITTFFSLTAWGTLADAFYQRVKRGDLLFVQGRLRIRAFRQGGVMQYRPEIHLDSFHLIQQFGSRGKSETTAAVLAANG